MYSKIEPSRYFYAVLRNEGKIVSQALRTVFLRCILKSIFSEFEIMQELVRRMVSEGYPCLWMIDWIYYAESFAVFLQVFTRDHNLEPEIKLQLTFEQCVWGG